MWLLALHREISALILACWVRKFADNAMQDEKYYDSILLNNSGEVY